MAFSSSRALTRAHTLMKLLPPRVAAPFSLRSLSSAASPPKTSSNSNSNFGSGIPSKGSDFHSKLCPNGEACSLVNRFMKEGSSIPYKVMEDNEAMYARLDIPGIGKKGLKLWVEDNSVHVNGEEEEEKCSRLVEECRRKYYGNIDIPQSSCYKVEEIAAELKNGVLKVKIPKRKDIINVKVNGPSSETGLFDDAFPWLILWMLFWS